MSTHQESSFDDEIPLTRDEAAARSRATKATKAAHSSGRRRFVDPATCERDYSGAECEFLHAIREYKRTSGRHVPDLERSPRSRPRPRLRESVGLTRRCSAPPLCIVALTARPVVPTLPRPTDPAGLGPPAGSLPPSVPSTRNRPPLNRLDRAH